MPNKLFKNLRTKIKSLKILDWILIIFGLLTILVFSVLFFRKSSNITVTIKVGSDSVFYDLWVPSLFDSSGTKDWYAESFYRGQTERDGLGKTQALVLDVFSYNKTQTRKTVYLTVNLNVTYNPSSNTYTYKGVPVLVGSSIKLNLDRTYVNGLITSVEGYPKIAERKSIVVEAQIREENSTFLETAGTKSYIADAIKIGDEVKDNNGTTLIKVLDKRVFPAKKTVTTSDGRVLERNDPSRKDVFLTLLINAEKIGNKYYLLDDIPILVDQILPINTQAVSIFPIVTKFLSY